MGKERSDVGGGMDRIEKKRCTWEYFSFKNRTLQRDVA